MNDALEKLLALARAAMSRLVPDDPAVWEAAMQRELAKTHTAAALVGVAQRDFGGKVRALLGRLVGARALPSADRARLAATLETQYGFLARFAQQLAAGELSDAAIVARMNLYAASTKQSYWGARYPGLPGHPGDGGTACKTNCKCTLEERDGGVWWVLHPAEHCDDCRARAAGSPYQAKRA